ncbi:MAG: hypothetical protein ACKVYV_15850 [Limisphaerales bacterium]
MKSVLTTTLIALTLVLCGFNAYQWYREARLFGDIKDLQDEVFTKKVALQESSATIRRTQEEVGRIDALRLELDGRLKTNRFELDRLSNSNLWLRGMMENSGKQADAYKGVVDKANEAIKQQNDMIAEQNQKMVELANQRNDFVEKYKKLADDYNSLAGEYKKIQGLYEDLVNKWNAAQTQGEKKGG